MEVIRIGLLFSLTGTTSTTEQGQYQAALYALKQYNQQTKSSKRTRFTYEVRDISSDPHTSYHHALELAQSGVKVFIGCYTSACRKAILPVLEQYGCLLVYPALYEGQEIHPNVLYTGEVPNQQIRTLLQYAVNHFGRSFYLIGNDYIYPRYTNQQVRQLLEELQADVVGEAYVPLGHSHFSPYFQEMERNQPSTILSTLVGESISHFYRAYYHCGYNPSKMPIMSPITTEVEIKAMGSLYAAGHLSCANYFQSLDNPENRSFVQGLSASYGPDVVVSSVMSNTYTGIMIVLNAISQLKTTDFTRILKFLYGKSFHSPSGMIQVNRDHHLSLQVRVGQSNLKGQFEIVWDTNYPIAAKPLMNDTIDFASDEVDRWKEVVEAWGELSSEAVIVLDDNNLVLYANPEAFSITRLQRGNVLHANYLRKFRKTYNLMEHFIGKDKAYKFVLLRKTGEKASVVSEKEDEAYKFDRIWTWNSFFKKELSVAKIASASEANVLILGETGTGKEVMARAIHNQSPRCQGPFIAVNAGAMPRELIASELFGYVDGAFTGSRKGGAIGKFEAADGGTLFLDEIGEMPLELQVSLLRVLEDRMVVRMGDHKERRVNVRVIAATNRHLNEEIAYQGSFRSDLFYRLNVFTINIPPLHQRVEDIEFLALQFLKQFQNQYEKGPCSLSLPALLALQRYQWPGNIRELKNVIERAFFLSIEDVQIDVCHLPPAFQIAAANPKVPVESSLRDLEKSTILRMLRDSPSISEAARKLGITRSTLYRKMNKWGIKA